MHASELDDLQRAMQTFLNAGLNIGFHERELCIYTAQCLSLLVYRDPMVHDD